MKNISDFQFLELKFSVYLYRHVLLVDLSMTFHRFLSNCKHKDCLRPCFHCLKNTKIYSSSVGKTFLCLLPPLNFLGFSKPFSAELILRLTLFYYHHVFFTNSCLFFNANICRPDQTPRFVASDLGLHCLPTYLLGNKTIQYKKLPFWTRGINGLMLCLLGKNFRRRH